MRTFVGETESVTSAMARIIECVPNFSEGRDKSVIDAIVKAIGDGRDMIESKSDEATGGCDTQWSGAGVKVLHVDAGMAAHRTVVTFVGSPEAVCEAAFRGVRIAGELIDMRLHHGTHPRSGATDVLPLIPIAGISLAECAELGRRLAARIYGELGIACYCYEASALIPEHRNLAACRAGEYEALPEKMNDPVRRPDFAPAVYNERMARSGATTVGARDFLIAVNFNLNSTSVPLATDIACDVREKGRRTGDGWIRGTLKGCKAIGWYIDEYGIAQVSMNITDIHATPLHTAYEEVCRAAAARGTVVTGTEIIGLVPKRVLVDAGRYFLRGAHLPTDHEEELIAAAISAMHLDDLRPFNPRLKVIEYRMEEDF